MIDQKIAEFKRQIVNPDLNIENIDGSDLSLERLSSALCSQPLLGGEKLVIISDFELRDEFIPCLNNIPPEIRVVFRSDSVDKRTKFYKLVNERGEVVEFKTYAPWEQAELINWIGKRVEGRGKRIADNAARLLQEICGNNLRLLDSEIEKIATYIGERQEITEADVSTLASSLETNAFALLDALRNKKLNEVLVVFQSLLKNKEDLFQLLGLIISQYRLMIQIKSLGGRDLSAIVGSPYYIKKCAQNIARFSLEELKNDLYLLLETNLKLKTGEDQAATFELLLTGLCGQ